MVLLSPGVEITVEDQTIPGATGPGTIPLIFIATEENKQLSNGAIAPGTLKSNAGQLYAITSQRELIETFGTPIFHTENGTPVPGHELNEYGLHAAYQFLGIANRVWIVRADVNLAELQPSQQEPTAEAPSGTYWFDLTSTLWGIFRSNGNSVPALAWESQSPLIFNAKEHVEKVYIGSLGLPSGALGLSGTLTLNGNNISVVATDSANDIANKVNTAGISDVKAVVIRLIGQNWFVLRNTSAGDIVIGGTASVVNGLGLDSPTEIIQPNINLGTTGSLGVVTYASDNVVFEKILPTDELGQPDSAAIPFWFAVGSNLWKMTTPTAVAGVDQSSYLSAPLNAGDELIISDGTNSVTVTFTAADVGTLSAVVTKIQTEITNASLDNVFAVGFDSLNRIVISNITGNDLIFTDSVGTPTSTLGLQSLNGNKLFYAPHYSIPGTYVEGDIWINITTPNKGADYIVKYKNPLTGSWDIVDAPFYQNDDRALAAFGTAAPAGTLYVQYNLYGDALNPVASHMIRKFTGNNRVVAAASQQPGISTPPLVPGDQFVIVAGKPDGTQEVRVITLPSSDIDDLATAINVAGFSNVAAYIEGGYLKVENTAGFSLTITYVDPVTSTDYSTTNTGDPLGSLGLQDENYYSNFVPLDYVASFTEPRAEVPAGTYWYNDSFEVDIMVNDGTQWRGYKNYYPNTNPTGPILSSTPPTTQTDGTPLVENDLWIDTSDVENYPRIYRWRTATNTWEPIDNTDQSTPLGIVFADARWNNNGQVDGSRDPADMVVSDFVDPDAPDPLTYPAGILLFNTRYSSRNVKVWAPDYLKDFVNISYTVGGATFPAGTITSENTGRWVTESGNRVDGSPYMGRHAQRIVIVRALQAAVNSNDNIRSEATFFNLLAAPGYPELIEELVALNVDKKEIAFIVGDTPARLQPNSSDIVNWATNANNAPFTGDEGLTVQNSYVGLYYPWALSTNIDGTEIVVPPSTVALRVMAYNDLVSFPWFAPAGFTRGLVTNATSVGYINKEGEFVPTILNQGQRDILYENKINPIAFMPGRGLVIYGQKTLDVDGKGLDRVNVARLINYLRYNFEILARPWLFEPNDKMTRDQVKVTFERFLSNLMGLRAIADFLVICDESNNTPDRIDRNELWIHVAIIPVQAVEFIKIPIIIQSTGTSLTNLLPGVPAQI